MPADILAPALIQSMARGLSLLDLIRTADQLARGGQADVVETLYATWIAHNEANPLFYAALFNHAVVLTDLGKLDGAREALERAIAINPDFMPAHINLGRIYERQTGPALAVVQLSKVLQKLETVTGSALSHKITALNQIARMLETATQDETAENMLKQSLELDPRQREVSQHLTALRQRQCEWPAISPWDRVDRDTLMTGISPLSIAALTDDPLMQLGLAWHYNRADVGTPPRPMRSWPQAATGDGRLRVGYLSSDLREHAVGHLMLDVLGLHDRAKVEVFAYYFGPPASDPMHLRFKDSADHWVDLSADDEAAARQIAADGIHILVDLNGYTREGRLKVVAQRPAPVIVNWLGFPGTMASPYHHFIVADDTIVPADHARYYTEEVLRLPCYQPNTMKRVVAERAPTRAEQNLPDDAVVFCCFNGAHKITQFTFDRWLSILAGVPGSVLWLLGSTEAAHQRLRDHATQRGIAADRLVFADKLANPYHLARYRLADLFLDTTPYGAHTTASDALWMGVPVLTWPGRSFASRVCASLVTAAGLPDLVCDSAAAYVGRAIELGRDKAALAGLRRNLDENRDTCTLFDTPKLVRHLEDLFAQIWARHQAGTLPRPDLTNLDVYLEVGLQTDHEQVEMQDVADYDGWWLDRLARRHLARPIGPDRRLVGDPAALDARVAE